MSNAPLAKPGFRRKIIAISFLLPHMLGVLYFFLLPMVQVLLRSFQSAVGGRWVGLQNYRTVFQNTAFALAASNTARFIAVCVPILVGLSLILTVAVQSLPLVGKTVRSAFLLPMAIPAASVVLVWKALFHDNGLINHALLDINPACCQTGFVPRPDCDGMGTVGREPKRCGV